MSAFQMARIKPSESGGYPEELLAKIVGYLGQGTILYVLRTRAEDVVDPSRGSVVPLGALTDGQWVWQLGDAYYLSEHGFRLPAEFVEHMAEQNFSSPQPDEDTRVAVMAELSELMKEP